MNELVDSVMDISVLAYQNPLYLAFPRNRVSIIHPIISLVAIFKLLQTPGKLDIERNLLLRGRKPLIILVAGDGGNVVRVLQRLSVGCVTAYSDVCCQHRQCNYHIVGI